MDNTKEYIACSAILFDDGKKHVHQPINVPTGFIVCGLRHHNCLATMAALGLRIKDGEQGFLTSKNRFVNRHSAALIARSAGQVDFKGSSKKLMSEDIY
jgi:hypothetical protein